MVCQIVFFHPVLWLAYRRLSWERELVCDEAVVEHRGERRVEYADCLATLARWWFQGNEGITAIDFASSPSLIATRVRALLREPIAHSPLRIVATSALTASTLKFPQEPNPRGCTRKLLLQSPLYFCSLAVAGLQCSRRQTTPPPKPNSAPRWRNE